MHNHPPFNTPAGAAEHPAVPAVPHMTPDQFRRLGHRMIDWIAEYMERLPRLPVLSRATPGQVLAAIPDAAPHLGLGDPGLAPDQAARAWDPMFHDLETIILPALTHWQAPGFFAFFPCNASGPAILGELLSAGLNVNGMLWATSPAATELETRVMDWLGTLIGLPQPFLSTSGTGGGVIQGTASESALIALVAARARLRRLASNPDPAFTDARATIYASGQAHSSIVKAAMIAGLASGPDDRRRVRLVPTRPDGAIDTRALESFIRADLAAGLLPAWICATAGTTSSTAVDDLPAIADVLHRAALRQIGTWLHVDAAHAGAACICPEFRWILRGVEHADSVCFNPHKWLLTNFDCDAFWTTDRAALIQALSITPEYLRNAASASGKVIDYRDWQIPLGRRFRALKLWFVLRHYGVQGLQAYIREHMRLAELFEACVHQDHRFEIAAPRTMNLVCFRLRGHGPAADARNQALLQTLNASGQIYLTHTTLPIPISTTAEGQATDRDGPPADQARTQVVLRLAIGATTTQERHVREAWTQIQAAAVHI